MTLDLTQAAYQLLLQQLSILQHNMPFFEGMFLLINYLIFNIAFPIEWLYFGEKKLNYDFCPYEVYYDFGNENSFKFV